MTDNLTLIQGVCNTCGQPSGNNYFCNPCIERSHQAYIHWDEDDIRDSKDAEYHEQHEDN